MDWAAISHPGSREVNEDSTGIAETQDVRCFVVADGLGGHGMGDTASQTAVEAFRSVFQGSSAPLTQTMEAAFLHAQDQLLAEQNRLHVPAQMKTTAVALAVDQTHLIWGHIGDSRLYSFRWGRVRQLTRDHSVPQMLVMTKQIRPQAIRFHPDRNMLLRVLGLAGEPPRFELSPPKKRKKKQVFLLCTDGFWEWITEKEMAHCLRSATSAEDWLTRMEQIILSRGEGLQMDNLSAIGVWL